MKVSTKGRYALRMLLDLAEHSHGGDEEFVPLKDIAERQDISKPYLEQIISIMNASGIMRANRGKRGGYMLAKPAAEITVGQILRQTEGGLSPVACLDDEVNRCKRISVCKTLPMWTKLDKIINNYLDSVSLQDMLDEYQSQYQNVGEYVI